MANRESEALRGLYFIWLLLLLPVLFSIAGFCTLFLCILLFGYSENKRERERDVRYFLVDLVYLYSRFLSLPHFWHFMLLIFPPPPCIFYSIFLFSVRLRFHFHELKWITKMNAAFCWSLTTTTLLKRYEKKFGVNAGVYMCNSDSLATRPPS